MEDMSDAGMSSAETYAYIYWYVLAVAMLVTATFSWSFRVSTWSRLRGKKGLYDSPASTSILFTPISLAREVFYVQPQIPLLGCLPNFGTLFVLAGYTAILLVCLLSNVWATIPVFWEAIAMRAAYLSVAQLSLLIGLSTKKNLIAYLFNTSHERLIIYHQFIGVCLLMTTTLHMGYFLREWLYYDVWKSQWAEMGVSMLQWGFAAWGLLLFTVASSISILRSRLYDYWLLLHIATMLAFFAMLILHLDPPYRVWAYVPLAIWALDRCSRMLNQMRLNSSLISTSMLTAQARITPLPGDVVRVVIRDFTLKRTPGQYVYLSIYKVGLNSHPFTVVSSCDSSDLVLLVKAKRGLSRRLHQISSEQLPPNEVSLRCCIEGPYGGTQTPFQSFDSAVLISGGSGGTFTINLLRELVTTPGCCRTVLYIWAIKAECHAEWFADELKACKMLAYQNGVELQTELWVTRDDSLTSDSQKSGLATCRSPKCRCQERMTPADRPSTASTVSSSSASEILMDRPPCCCSRRLESEKAQPWVVRAGRPDLYSKIANVVQSAYGETGVAVCGPQTLTCEIRNTVARISDERACKKGSGAEAIYLHVENQA